MKRLLAIGRVRWRPEPVVQVLTLGEPETGAVVPVLPAALDSPVTVAEPVGGWTTGAGLGCAAA